LAAEQRWLQQLFEGTPVRISSESDGNVLQLLVPVTFSFDGESTKPKPALQAVLDKVSQSLKRQPNSRLRIGAPGPAARALAARQHLLSRGVAAHRVEAASVSKAEDVQLRLSLANGGSNGQSSPQASQAARSH
jgi:outer membrane protein OmpA-like peptidoglycan-associated protein